MKYTVVILHNIISPYKTLLFNTLYEKFKSLKVLYLAETERRRKWKIKYNELKFPYEIMFNMPLDGIPKIFLFIKTWQRLSDLNPDILIIGGYSYASYWAGFLWAKLRKRKIILWSASNEEDKDRLFINEKFKSFFVNRCDAANVYGKRGRDYLLKLGMSKNRIFIIGNVTDNSFYYNKVMKLKTKREVLCNQFGIPDHNFVYIGRLSREKNILNLLDAYSRLKSKEIGWGLILVGNGPQKIEIEDYIKKHSLKDIFLPGFRQKEEIPQYLAVSDVFILPSISEPWGLVVNEAMAAGLPILVSIKCGCYPDLVKDGVNGFSFNPFDVMGLYNLMKNIVQEKYDLNEMGEASLFFINKYSPENASNIIKRTIDEVL